MFGYDYPLLGIFWSILMFAAVVIVIFTVIYAFIDNFRRRDHSGWAKAAWALIIIIFPLLGTIIYLVARPADVELAGG